MSYWPCTKRCSLCAAWKWPPMHSISSVAFVIYLWVRSDGLVPCIICDQNLNSFSFLTGRSVGRTRTQYRKRWPRHYRLSLPSLCCYAWWNYQGCPWWSFRPSRWFNAYLHLHLFRWKRYCHSSSPIGAGVSFAQKYRGKKHCTFALDDDGASNQGQVFEPFNMVKR